MAAACLIPIRDGIVHDRTISIILLKFRDLLSLSNAIVSLSKAVMTYCRVVYGMLLGFDEPIECHGLCCGYHETS